MTTTSRTEPSWAALSRGWNDASRRADLLRGYRDGSISFVPHLLPEQAVNAPTPLVLEILGERLGEALDLALSVEHCEPAGDPLPASIRSPVADRPDGSWIRHSNVVGVNVRTIGSAWDVVKYALTLPAAYDAIHLLPIWQPGVVESLYGPSSWDIDGSLFSRQLAAVRPHLHTPERQLRAVVHVLHAMGRTVGMDVIPHADRYCEMALTHPEHFEWLRREDTAIVDHRADLHEEVQRRVHAFVQQHGPAVSGLALPGSAAGLFGPATDEATRRHLIFGRAGQRQLREDRRIALVKWLRADGFEPVPATMAPPYRGLEVDPDTEIVDQHGLRWRDYRITEPQEMSRVFGPLARYKLYGRLDDNADWAIDFDRPREATWAYVCEHYADVQRRFGFDFMRGDMSHVQMRPGGVPDRTDDRYDVLRAVKETVVAGGTPWFAYFAESFLGPRDFMAYGDEVDHLEACEADATLGNLQSMVVGSAEWLAELRRYIDIGETRGFAPSLTAITADKDDPRFDAFFVHGNAARTLLSLFVPDLPSYVGLGFEVRDVHLQPAPNEHYTKLYVFRERQGPKATRGPWIWGRNAALFAALTDLRLAAEEIAPRLRGRRTRWVLPPDPTGELPVIAWTQAGDDPDYLFVVNTGASTPVENLGIPALCAGGPPLDLRLCTHAPPASADEALAFNGHHYKLSGLAPRQCRIYGISR